jgi:integrase
MLGPPKSESGKRTVAIPEVIIADLRLHLESFVTTDGEAALLFTSPAGHPLRHGHFRTRVWQKSLAKVGLEGLHFHDLRHTGNNLAASTGASLRELMDRMGEALSKLAKDELRRATAGSASGSRASSGTQRARRPRSTARRGQS